MNRKPSFRAAKNTLYYVSAQLRSGGRIVCRVIVGTAVRAGNAIGGSNVCTTQTPSDPLGGWK